MAERTTAKRSYGKVHGGLTEESSLLTATMKQLLTLGSDEVCDRVSSALKQMLSVSGGKAITHGSLCSGSGLGMQAVTKLIISITLASGEDYSSQCVFACELHLAEAKWLKDIGVQKIFGDLRCVGCGRALDIITNTPIDVPSVDVLEYVCSCKDLSAITANASAIADYVQAVLADLAEQGGSSTSKTSWRTLEAAPYRRSWVHCGT